MHFGGEGYTPPRLLITIVEQLREDLKLNVVVLAAGEYAPRGVVKALNIKRLIKTVVDGNSENFE